MHSWHYGDDWAFHANGDPVPGDVLINKRGDAYNPDDAPFRSTAQEIVTFVMAVMIEAATPYRTITLNTTLFTLDGDNVLLARCDIREKDDADEMVVPFCWLKEFAHDIVRLRFDDYMTEVSIDARTAGMGMFMVMSNETHS